MNVFIVGDVHGCLNTLKTLLASWNPDEDQLVFVGDLIDRGNFSPETVKFIRELQKKYTNTIVLMGNHEYEASKQMRLEGNQSWFQQMGDETIRQYKSRGFDLKEDVLWFEQLPLYWQNDYLFVSHAGISNVFNPFDKDDRMGGILWTRMKLKNLDKIQVHGHTPKSDGPIYTDISSSWNIDTACVYGERLCALKFETATQHISFVEVKVDSRDLA